VLLITDGEPCSDGNLPGTPENYATGKSKFDCAGTNCPAVSNATAPAVAGESFSFPATAFPTCGAGSNVAGVEDVALYMHTKNLRPDISATRLMNLSLYFIFAFGRDSSLLKYAAINGGFEDVNASGTPDIQEEWDSNKDGMPDTYYEADDGYQLEEAMRNALSTMLKRASSGTAASVLASGEGSGANLVQAVFYPRRRFGNDIIGWTGALQNLWYYVDPAFTSSNIREDTVQESPDRILHLINDYVAQLYFDPTLPGVKARRAKDSDGNGSPDVTQPAVQFENMGNIWESAKRLWTRDLATSPRRIFTNCTGLGGCIGSTNLMNLSIANEGLLQTSLQLAGDSARTKDLIRYMHGYDLTEDGFSFDYDPEPPLTFVDRNVDNIPDYRVRHATLVNPDTGALESHIWKLGDILNSTPKIVSWLALNEYKKVYNDTSYLKFTETTSTTSPPLNYKDRGMVFTGGNDGMLHAFKLGKLVLDWNGQNKKLEKAKLVNGDPSVPLGEEMWAFIPKNALPYLKYFADPDYCHVFTVDLSPFIFDASIGAPGTGDISNDSKPLDGSTWRTILIGGMRYGGACRDATGTCASTTNGVPDCVKTPVQGLGFSSYFALDITDFLAHENDPDPALNHPPVLLWEFSDPQLGFTTTGPAVVKLFADDDTSKNGKWFVTFGSGPTGGINTANNQFMGNSDQNLRFFVLDLKSGSLLRKIDTGISNAFAGSMINATYDHRLKNYSDDAFYVGFVKKGATAWTNGGVGRILTKEDPNPDNWEWSIVKDNLGPVSSAITQMYNSKTRTLWLYFGTGRYFFESGTSPDDPSTQRALYGLKDPCVDEDGNFDPASCTTVGALTDRTSYPAACIANPAQCDLSTDSSGGWSINLDLPANNVTYCDAYNPDGSCAQSSTRNYWAERIITDPVASPGAGVIFFTTYRPYNDECGLGGKSFIWAIGGATGVSGVSTMKGVALLQVSTGSIEQIELKKAFAFTAEGKQGRRTGAMEGVPPTSQGLALISQPMPSKRVVHIKER
jgi:type IV pilus assembly protein PilY1